VWIVGAESGAGFACEAGDETRGLDHMLKKMATMAAALSLIAGSAAPAIAANPLSLANAPSLRGSAELGSSSRLNGDDTTMQLISIGVVALVVLGIVLLLDDDVDLNQRFPPQPTSP
jgi:hypothetical protein